MNVVAGCRATTRSNASRSSSNGGKPGSSGRPRGRVGQKCQSACAASSSHRSFVASSGSKNAIGIRDVDQDGQAKLAGRRPQRVEARVVDGDQASGRIARPKSQRLPDLQAAGATGHRVAQSPRLRFPEGGIGRPALVVDAPEDHDSPGVRYLPAFNVARQVVAGAAVEVHKRLHAGVVERRQELRWRPRRPAAAKGRAEVVVGIDGREAGAPDLVDGPAKHAPRPVVCKQQVVGAAHAGLITTTWLRCRGRSGSRPRVSASVSASAWPG